MQAKLPKKNYDTKHLIVADIMVLGVVIFDFDNGVLRLDVLFMGLWYFRLLRFRYHGLKYMKWF